MYELPRVNVEVERGSTFTISRYLSYIASILLRAYVRKNNATVEIYPNKHFIPFKGGWVIPHLLFLSWYKASLENKVCDKGHADKMF